jgi:hypothetical protein
VQAGAELWVVKAIMSQTGNQRPPVKTESKRCRMWLVRVSELMCNVGLLHPAQKSIS